MSAETVAERAASVQGVIDATASETPSVREAALAALEPPSRTTTDVVWIILVTGLVLLLVLALLALAHVIGDDVADDKIVTLFTTVLAGLLGLFVKSPVQK